MDKVLIIGGSGGIGAALARRLHARGTPVHLMARDAERLQAIAAEVGASQTAGDARDEAALAAAITAASSDGRLGGLAYCVGSIVLKSIKTATASDYREAFELNVIPAALAIRQAAPALAQARGSIVLFSTVAVSQGFTNHAVIGAAKGAIEGLGLSVAADLAPQVRVNCIAPSLTRTPLAEALTRSEQMATAIARLHPIDRLGEPEDIAALADFLLSADSSWITGQVLRVDGGRSTLRPRG